MKYIKPKKAAHREHKNTSTRKQYSARLSSPYTFSRYHTTRNNSYNLESQ